MPCTSSCLASVVIIISSLYMNYSINNQGTMKNYEASLSPELKEIYLKIVRERQNIYIQGYILGFILSTIFLLINFYQFKKPLNTISSICIVITISYITNHLYYMLMPKTDNMLSHLKTEEEIAQWKKMYDYMKYQFHLSFVVGIVALAFYAYTFC